MAGKCAVAGRSQLASDGAGSPAAAAQTTDPLKRREDALRRDQARLTKSMKRLLTGYQENLITLEELRWRMPELRKQQRAIEAELQSLEMTAVGQTRNLRLVETLAELRTRLFRKAAHIWEVTRGPNDPYVATALNNLAGLLRATGRAAEAAPLEVRVAAIREGSESGKTQ